MTLMRKLSVHDLVGRVKLAIERILTDDISPVLPVVCCALSPLCSCLYRSKAPIKLSTADLCSYRRARARRRTSSGGCTMRRWRSWLRSLSVESAIRLFLAVYGIFLLNGQDTCENTQKQDLNVSSEKILHNWVTDIWIIS